jgi:hypothetical protein
VAALFEPILSCAILAPNRISLDCVAILHTFNEFFNHKHSLNPSCHNSQQWRRDKNIRLRYIKCRHQTETTIAHPPDTTGKFTAYSDSLSPFKRTSTGIITQANETNRMGAAERHARRGCCWLAYVSKMPIMR